jgi:cytochrome o ubiquinol oxidase subunit IV
MSAHGNAQGMGHGTLRSYYIGFGLSVVLTALAFWLVMAHVIENKQIAAFLIMGLAAAQIIVHVFCFLHINTKSEDGWTMMAFIFTVVMVVIVLSGSLWVMYNLNVNMMPASAHEMSKIP